MKPSHRLLFILISILLPFTPSSAEEPGDTVRSMSSATKQHFGFELRPTYIIPTNALFKGANRKGRRMSEAFSAHMKYGFQYAPHTRYGSLYPHTRQGIGLSYNTFFNKAEVGNPIALYLYQNSRIAKLSPVLSLNYEWNFGASFGWKKHEVNFDSPGNVIGSKVNAYINLGLFLNRKISQTCALTAGVDITHFSNGNTRYPNSGVNTIGARLGLLFTPKEEESATSVYSPQVPSLMKKEKRIHYDLVLYGGIKCKGMVHEGDPHLLSGSFAVAGFNFHPMYNLNRFFRAGISLDGQYDESANLREYVAEVARDNTLICYRPPFKEQISVGLSARGELVMPIFSINVGIGYNVYQKSQDTQGFYQTLALKTSISRSLFLHMGYQLFRFHLPNHLMMGIGYRFNAQ